MVKNLPAKAGDMGLIPGPGTLGVGDGQGGLACCDSWGRKELNTTECRGQGCPVGMPGGPKHGFF